MTALRQAGRGLESPIVDVLNTRIAQLRKQGRDVISIAQAVPGFPPPSAVEKAAGAALKESAVNTYTADAGIPELRDAIAAWLGRVGRGRLSASNELIVTAGANQAFLLAALTILQPGDAAILAAPYFFNHEMALQAASVRPIEVACPWDAAGVEELLQRLTPDVKAVVLTTPSNPTGEVMDEPAVCALADALHNRGVWLIVDETYLTFVYDAVPFSATRLIETGNVIVVGSFSKTFSMMGWRLGYLAAPQAVIEEAIKVQDAMIICPTAISQYALLGALKGAPDYCAGLLPELRERRAFMAERVQRLPGVRWAPTGGGFFAFVKIPNCTDSLVFALDLLEETGVATVPGRSFGRAGEGHLRLSYGSATIPQLSDALDRMASYFERHNEPAHRL